MKILGKRGILKGIEKWRVFDRKMRIDCQSHIFPDAYIDILAQNPRPPQVIRHGSEAVVTYGDVQTFRLQDEAYDPKRKLKDMDEAGVDMALLSTNIPPPCMLALN